MTLVPQTRWQTKTMQQHPIISVEELQKLFANHQDNLLIIDARFDLTNPSTGQQLYTAGHIPSAQFIDLDKDLCGKTTGKNGRHPLPSKEALASTLQKIGMSNDSRVVIYEQGSGMFSAHLWWMLLWLGHARVQVLNGGYTAWVNAGGAVSTSTNAARLGDFQPKASLAPTVDADYVLSHLNSADMLLIDARAPERYRGDVEPLDPVAGHIPGAVNRPFSTNIDANGLYKSAAALQKEWADMIGNTPTENIVQQCGSGVSACHNILAMAHAGFGLTKIYPGSWSEWCSDPERPTEKTRAIK